MVGPRVSREHPERIILLRAPFLSHAMWILGILKIILVMMEESSAVAGVKYGRSPAREPLLCKVHWRPGSGGPPARQD